MWRVRLTAKAVSLTFGLCGVLLFILQFVPTYTGRGVVFVIFVIGGFIWALDTIWSTLNDMKEIARGSNNNQQTKPK